MYSRNESFSSSLDNQSNHSNELSKLTQSNSVSSTVFGSLNGTPGDNLEKVLELLGGVEQLIGEDDIVIIKPNAQWWNQGAPNLKLIKVLVDEVMGRAGGFRGEVVLAENCHRGPRPWETAGWATPFARNSDLPGISTLNELGELIQRTHGGRFSVCHWIDVGVGGRRVAGPQEGEGYVYCDGTHGAPLVSCENGASGAGRRTTIMTYPIFCTSRGTVIDFKNGVWDRGSYTGRPLRFINLSALNHHSTYCGMTSAVKNYMGIADLTGGPDPASGGRLTGEHFNFHSFPFDKWAPGPQPGMLGREIGFFMKAVRKADLNIISAEWVGLSSRTDPPVARTRAVLASEDPVALDHHSAKYLLYPNSRISVHDPDRPGSPVRQYLAECAGAGAGTLDERRVRAIIYDFNSRSVSEQGGAPVLADIEWGKDPRCLAKYLLLRMGLAG